MGRNSIPECPVVTDLIPGDPSVLDALADTLSRYAASSVESAGRMRPLANVEEWGGPAAEGFVGQMKDLPKTMDKGVKHFTDAANALRGYAATLRQAQAEVAGRIIPDANSARAWSAQWKLDREAVKNGTLQQSMPDKDLGKERLDELADELGAIRKRLEGVEGNCCDILLKGRDAAPSGGDPITTSLKAFGGGAKDGVTGLLQTAQMLNPGRAYAEPGAYGTDLLNIARGFQRVINDPEGFAKDFVNWDEWRKNPARALGLAVPDLTLSVLTGGAGKGAGLLKPDLPGKPDAPKAPDPVDLTKKGRPCDSRESCGDPVDPVTGEVTLTATDVCLPGALPLVLARSHGSAYRHGRRFGRSWASTLDQHIELDAAGVAFHASDGVTLRYPVPEPGQLVLPYTGSRWPMAWDGEPGGVIVISQPKLGRTLTFRPTTQGSTILDLESIIDRNGNAIAYDYDDQGVLIGVRHNGGYHIAVDSEADRIVGLRLLDAHPETHFRSPGDELPLVRFTYSEAGELAGVIDSSGEPQCFAYDDEHRLTCWQDRNGTTYHYEYDAGRCSRTRGPDGFLDASFHYDDERRVTCHTNSLGDVTKFFYNEWSQVERITDPLGNSVTKEWDRQHRLLARYDQLGRATRFTYDELGNKTREIRPDNTTITAEYDPMCLLVRFVGAGGAVWSFSYSESGNLRTVTNPVGATTSYTSDPSGNIDSITNALGATTRVVHDAAGLPAKVIDPLGAVTAYARDALGRVTVETGPDGAVTRRRWTVEGRPAGNDLPDGSHETWVWDPEGNLIERRNPAGSVTHYEISYFDLPSSRTEPDGARYEFSYDTELRLTGVVNPLGQRWSYEYDPGGRLVAEVDFDGREVTYRHDPAGRLVLRSNGAAEAVTYEHDASGRVISQRHVDTGRTTAFTYDPAGRLTRATNPDVDVAFTRDALGRVTAETSNGRTLSSAYDALGRRTRRETPSGHVSEWTYDLAGRPVLMRSGAHLLEFAHDTVGREIERRFGERVVFHQEWDSADRVLVQAITLGDPRSAVEKALDPARKTGEINRRAYSYRADGHVSTIDDTVTGLTSYDLDAVGRITAVTGREWGEHYAYDAIGNQVGAAWSGGGSGAQGPRSVAGTRIARAGRTHYRYDDQGRITGCTRKTLSGKSRVWIFVWDPDDRLTDVTTPDGVRWNYIYDPLSRRTSKRPVDREGNPGDSVESVWDGTCLSEQEEREASSGHRSATTWIHLPGSHRVVAQSRRRTGDVAIPEGGNNPRFHAVETDRVGTPVQLVDENGRVVRRPRASAWGAVGSEGAGDESFPLRFPGQYFDPETGWHYNLFRYYDPESSTYASPDPWGLAPSSHPYAYPRNPLSLTDPLGLVPHECTGPGSLEGKSDQDVYDPAVPNNGRRITDIDHVENGVLWELKTAIGAGNIEEWIPKHITKKMTAYLDARQHLHGYEQAPIGLRFTRSGAEPAFRREVENAVNQFRAEHPGVDVRLEWAE
ncbi:hypothetical protein B4N89_16160 [Embleya scabrispora]|uniref:Type IV secretion protein Rhs n=1 Tax=Embleya scabrispora TaxID=159449 RepID=A0A1T3P013_9ACTN|nr:DUF6531 domain-containing protein [Embleya scabrispora]OPC82261.1 hypothetical protein B4N89_16160 [Embleya scabrispora]